MYTGLLHLHNILRWVILILLIVSIIQSYSAKTGKPGSGINKSGSGINKPGSGINKSSLFLLIAAHTNFLIGLYQYFAGAWGFKAIQENGMSEVMKNSALRFWAVEHLISMLIAVVLITIARGKVKKSLYSTAFWLYIVALVLILLAIPWPGREGIGRPLFPGM